jgi:hypothetical protein
VFYFSDVKDYDTETGFEVGFWIEAINNGGWYNSYIHALLHSINKKTVPIKRKFDRRKK